MSAISSAHKELPRESHSTDSSQVGHSKVHWAFHIFCLLLIVGLAIGWGVTASKPHDGEVCIPVVPAVYIPADPFAGDDKPNLDSFWDSMDGVARLGQLSLGFCNGKESPTKCENETDVGRLGAVLGVFDVDTANSMQNRAVRANGIPLLIGHDTVHGFRTIFPLNIAMAGAFNATMVEVATELAGGESKREGINWVYAPMLDLSRDARWGRMAEGFGENAYLMSKLGAAAVRGFLKSGVMPTVKHFAAYGAAQSGRDYNSVDMSLQMLYNDYLPAYRAAIEAAKGHGPLSVMAAFNTINFVPAHASKWLLSELLRDDWGFEGMVVSDAFGVHQLETHAVALTPQEGFAKSFEAGIDMDLGAMYPDAYAQIAIDEALITADRVDVASKRIIKAKWDLGLLPVDMATLILPGGSEVVVTTESRAIARNAVRQSTILLKNDVAAGLSLPMSQTLPDDMRIAVIGYLADSRINSLGSWPGQYRAEDTTTFLAGMRSMFPSDPSRVAYQPGHVHCDRTVPISSPGVLTPPEVCPDDWPVDLDGTAFPCNDEDLLTAALELVKSPTVDRIFVVLGEANDMNGEAASRAYLNITFHQQQLLQKIVEAVSDVGIVSSKLLKHITLVVYAGRPLTIQWEHQNIPAILYSWNPGTEAGSGLADVIFGVETPEQNLFGRAPVTFLRAVGQAPLFFEYMHTARPALKAHDVDNIIFPLWRFGSRYIDERWSPQFPFGYGLTYSTFSYSPPMVMPTSAPAIASSTFHVTCKVTNTGSRGAAEVFQLYAQQPAGKGVSARPVRQLIAFERKWIGAGATEVAEFHVMADQLGFYNENLDFVIEPTIFWFFCSPNSAHQPVSDFGVEFTYTLWDTKTEVTLTPA